MRLPHRTNLVSLALVATFATAFASAPPARAADTPIAAAPPQAAGAATVGRIVWGGAALPTPSPALAPFRDPADNALCISPRALAPLGVTYIVDREAGKVTLAGPDGITVATVELRTLPAALAADRPALPAGDDAAFIPAVAAIEGLGGKCEWNAQTNTLYARAVLTSVEMLGGQLRLKATLPVLPTVTQDRGGRQVILDIAGAEVGSLPHILDLNSPLVAQARVGQFRDDVARVVLDMKQPYAFSVLGGKASSQIVLNPVTRPPATITISNVRGGLPTVTKAAPTKKPTGKKPAPTPVSVVSGITYRKVSDNQAQILISANRVPAVRAALTRGRLTLDLLNVDISRDAVSAVAALGKVDHPLLKAARLLTRPSLPAQLVFDLARTVRYTLRPSGKGSYLLDLTLPGETDGQLSGKTIVVDAGHGGYDSGAVGVDGTPEKRVTLAIATQVADLLSAAGANVIMTRATDIFIPVDERPIIANRAGADFFISIHADSGDRNHSVNGSTVYYHFSATEDRALAERIATRLGSMGDIRSKGIGSDGKRFPGQGYGVLRLSQMTGVLVECGYMSNSADVKRLTDPAMQGKIARCIIAGVRDYIEANPNLDTRNTNPQPGDGQEVPLPPPGGDPTTDAPLPAPDPAVP